MRRIVCTTMIVFATTVIGLAQANVSKACVGTWNLNTAKSSFGKMPAPKSARLTVTKCSADEIAYTYTDVGADGKTFRDSWSGKPDGQMRPAKTVPPMDLKASFRWEGDVLIAAFDMGKSGNGGEQITFAEDGKTMTVKRTVGEDTSSQIWERVGKSSAGKMTGAKKPNK